MNLRRTVALACAVVLGLTGQGSVSAAPLAPGDVLWPAAAEANLGGVEVASRIELFVIPGSLGGSALARVYRNDPSNPLGGLTFIYELDNFGFTNPGDHSIGRFTLNGFAGFEVDASYVSPTDNVAPATIDRQENGNVIGFDFFPNGVDENSGFLALGTKSARLVLHTNAEKYHLTSSRGSIIDGGVAVVFLPRPVVPEPSSLLLGILGFAGLFVARRKRG